jgi:HTH-type transcriptional regulator / antitoxin HipB
MASKSLSPKNIGAIIRDKRIDNGLSQTELAKKIGASRFWVAEVERGKPRAELGLVLKALRALRLDLKIEALADPNQTATEATSPSPTLRAVDLQSVLDRTLAHPTARQR